MCHVHSDCDLKAKFSMSGNMERNILLISVLLASSKRSGQENIKNSGRPNGGQSQVQVTPMAGDHKFWWPQWGQSQIPVAPMGSNHKLRLPQWSAIKNSTVRRALVLGHGSACAGGVKKVRCGLAI